MTLFNLGSINADYFYQLSHLPKPGETLVADGMTKGLGGKGANMSVAAARAGAQVRHIGAVGPDGKWASGRLLEYGVDITHIATSTEPTAHAIISVDQQGENSIIIYPGANHDISIDAVGMALTEADTDDLLVIQNETKLQAEAAEMAQSLGMRVAYAAAPFDADAVRSVLPFTDYLILNEIEMQQLEDSLDKSANELGVDTVVVTKGAKGATVYSAENSWQPEHQPAFKVKAVDTTGAGDTFTGYFLAFVDRGAFFDEALEMASRAGALMVTRHGTADVIPDLKEVLDADL